MHQLSSLCRLHGSVAFTLPASPTSNQLVLGLVQSNGVSTAVSVGMPSELTSHWHTLVTGVDIQPFWLANCQFFWQLPVLCPEMCVHMAHTKRDCVLCTQQARLCLAYDWPQVWLTATVLHLLFRRFSVWFGIRIKRCIINQLWGSAHICDDLFIS